MLKLQVEFSAFLLISAIIAVVVAIVLFATYLRRKNNNRFSGFFGHLYDFFHFKWFLTEPLLKGLYTISAIFLTLYSFEAFMHFGNEEVKNIIIAFVMRLVVGNVLLRVGYEFVLALILLCHNIGDICKKMHGNSDAAVPLKNEPQSPEKSPNNLPRDPEKAGVVFCRHCGNRFSVTERNCPGCGEKRN